MSDELHVVYRHVGRSTWEVYSRPMSIHTDGRTLQEAREEFSAVAGVHFGADWADVSVVEHRELLVVPGVYIRIATDRHTLDREKVAQVFRESLTVPAQLDLLERSDVPVSSTGDLVFVACVEDDLLPWLSGQLGRADAFQVACLRDVNAVWWMPLAAPDAELRQDSETLAQAGLSSPTSTVADLMEVDTDPVTAPGATRPAPSGRPVPAGAPRSRSDRRKAGQRGGLLRPRPGALVAA